MVKAAVAANGGFPMSQAKIEGEAVDIGRLLAGAVKTIGSVRNCWLATAGGPAGSSFRPMGRLQRGADDDAWKIRFLTDGRSRKASEMRRKSEVAIIYQHDPDDAFVTLIGKATLLENASEDRKRWKGAYDAYFPSEVDRTNAIFVEVDVERMELWIRGVTPEPFGLQATVLERDGADSWRLIAG
jgi:general stress protein 26